ncbi:hypothetical protein SYNPS1DRAFT_21491 [Syncephalis pseudoplumigaleata]|uniref:Fanconi-associated nuclease n=1 Tax=Syncephalis pseudoplumigaleata TaxID=1712513 RepID=A0A4P9Z5C8_9FUNG|nr:hypothetical protein SYNPS1DRAFT_21491 [Syncephalis pseudoplumigaleata]|eukprot:RKP26820.1 hypothetical protein SYNPS1DRAFT_21491 [Syncephalis pseudoplumigaleata]
MGSQQADGALPLAGPKKRSNSVEQEELPSKRERAAANSTYVQVMHHSLSAVLAQEAFLFDQAELNTFDAFRSLAASAQLLFARLYIRKHKWIRVDSINYKEIEDLEAALLQLGDARLTESYGEGEAMAVHELLATLTTEELRRLGSSKPGGRRPLAKEEHIAWLVDHARTQSKLSFLPRTGQASAQLSIDRSSGLDALAARALAMTGGVVRLSEAARVAFNRLHVVRYREVQTDHAAMLSSSLLVAFGLRRYPDYVVKRSHRVFPDRAALLAYEQAAVAEQQLHELMGERTQASIEAAWLLCQSVEALWDMALVEAMESAAYRDGNYFLARFSAEAMLLRKLLSQCSFRLGARGGWYERLALVQERYLKDKPKALAVCIEGLEDPHVWMAAQQSLQQRTTKLQRDLGVPSSERRCFKHLEAGPIPQLVIEGVRAGQGALGSKAKYTLADASEGTVEELALEHYASLGYQGVHSETSLLTTLFALLFWDVLFAEHEGVFETPEQSAPLDLATDAFYLGGQASDASDASDGAAQSAQPYYLAQLERIDDRERPHLTLCRGVSWDYTKDVLMNVARDAERTCKFVEVKGPGDRLSETQKACIYLVFP